MKKVLFTAFAGFCIFSSIMATSPHHQKKIKGNRQADQYIYIKDSIPDKKTDTSHIPKQDTMAMPQIKTQGVSK
jgi:hypothetical protein